jgi:hypothetical protein
MLLLGGAARAQEEQGPPDFVKKAGQLAREGQAEGNKDKLREAIGLYKQGYELTDNAVVFCNIGLAYRLLDDLPNAHAILVRCLPRLSATKPESVANFRQALDDVEAALPAKHLAVDLVSDPKGATVAVGLLDPDFPLTAPTVVWLPEGEHSITASMIGFGDVTQAVTITADDLATRPQKRVELTLERIVDVEKPVETAKPSPPSKRRTYGWVTLGVGGAFGIGGAIMHAITYKTRGELADLSGPAYVTKKSTFEKQRLATYSLYGAGAVLVAVGAALIATAPSPADHVSIAPAPAGDGVMIWLDL